ncbi:hypothetical protein LOZ65_002136 [Ophidiomyces ophidiicola]|nr:hypothetical protein LOZ65_002136 [Ophidiomyces ophidiicola]
MSSVEAPREPLSKPGNTFPSSPQQKDGSNRLTSFFLKQAIPFLVQCNLISVAAFASSVFLILYSIFGRVFLILTGVVGGVILHAWWEAFSIGFDENKAKESTQRQREIGVEVVRRLLAGVEPPTERTRASVCITAKAHTTETDLKNSNESIASAIEAFIDILIKDYIRWWYEPILPSEHAFPDACRRLMLRFVSSLSAHLGRKRPAELFVQFTMNSSSVMTVFLSELSMAVNLSNTDASVADALNEYLRQFPDSGLSNLLSTEQQRKRLSLLTSELLKGFLDPNTYDCELAQIFLREILTGVVLESTINTCSAPEYLNSWIVHLFKEGEPELVNAIDAGLDELEGVGSELGAVSADLLSASENSFSSLASIQSSGRDDLGHSDKLLFNSGSSSTSSKRVKECSLESAPNCSQGARRSRNTYDDYLASCPITSTRSTSDTKIGFKDLNPQGSAVISNLDTSLEDMSSYHGVTLPRSIQSKPCPKDIVNTTQSIATFHNASISILDDSPPNAEAKLRSKPTTEYLIQIEPSGAHLTGWMIARKYVDFEILHETLRRISVISGTTEFSASYADLPGWRNRRPQELCTHLERYLQDALHHKYLAESEGMKRFLEKGLGAASQNKAGTRTGFGFRNPAVFEAMGKNMMGVINPKGVAEGGKAMLGGVTGLFSNSANGSMGAKMESYTSRGRTESTKSKTDYDISLRNESRPDDFVHTELTQSSPVQRSHILDDDRTAESFSFQDNDAASHNKKTIPERDRSDSMASSRNRGTCDGLILISEGSSESLESTTCSNTRSNKTVDSCLSEEETILIIELLFAVVNEIYGLSSAWTLRKRLLQAAKSYILRPGNPSLQSIRQLIQGMISRNTTHEALAGFINTIRESCFATQVDEPSKSFPADADRSSLRDSARSLLISNGLPPALVGCMGVGATDEALGRIFDCLQVESVARGFVCSVILQALKIIVQ